MILFGGKGEYHYKPLLNFVRSFAKYPKWGENRED
jgi:hypothetical protein